jgi:hypothetical protein
MTGLDFIENLRYLQPDFHQEFPNIGAIMVRTSSIQKVSSKTELVNHDLLQNVVFQIFCNIAVKVKMKFFSIGRYSECTLLSVLIEREY